MMAGKSKHEKADRGRRSHSTYEQRHPQKPADAPGPSGREGAAFPSAPSHAPELFPRLFQASGDGIVLQEVCSPPGGGRFLEVNDGLCRMPGYTRDEILALMPFEVLGAEARTALAELVEKGTDTPRAFFETTLVAKDGSRIPVEVHTSRLQFQERPLVLSILRDITVRRQREDRSNRWKSRLEEEVRVQADQGREALGRLQNEVSRRIQTEREWHQRSRMLEAFFTDTITPLAFLDRQFCFVRVNEAYARSAGKDPEYFVGRNYFALHPRPEHQAIFEETIRRREPHHASAEAFLDLGQPQRGSTCWDWRLTPLCDEAGEVQFLALNVEDVTERQNALREMAHRAEQPISHRSSGCRTVAGRR